VGAALALSLLLPADTDPGRGPRTGERIARRPEPRPPAAPATAAQHAPRDEAALQRLRRRLRERLPRLRAAGARLRELRAREPQPSAHRIAALEEAGVLRPHAAPLRIGALEHAGVAAHKQGLPVLNRRGRLHRRGGALAGAGGRLDFAAPGEPGPVIPLREAIARAARAAGVTRTWAEPRVARGWFAHAGRTLPAWQVTLAARQPPGTWQVVLDARSGEVLAAVDRRLSAEGTGSVYDPNLARSPVPSEVTLHDLDDSGYLSGSIAQVFDLEGVGAFRPDRHFVFPPADPRFVQTSVYRGLTDTGRFAQAVGFPAFAQPLPAFVNLLDPLTGGAFNNAFYDPVFGVFGFGNGDGLTLANLGTDLDVAAHEMGHHVFETLVQPLVFSAQDPVLAMHEGVADTFAALVGGDPDVGESTLPGAPFLRTLANDRIFPDDIADSPHETGLVFGGANWDLIQALGADAFARLLLASLPFVPPEPDFIDYRDALRQGDQALSGGANRPLIDAVFAARGFGDLEPPPGFQELLQAGVPVSRFLNNDEFHFYLFAEFPGSQALSFALGGTGDADLYVFPLADPDSVAASENFFTSVERVDLNAFTSPSIDADDVWVVVVQDFFFDFLPSSYTLRVDEVLPPPALAIDGPLYSDRLDALGELDLFTFAGAAGQVVRLEAGAAPGSALDPLAVIFDAAALETLAGDDDSGPGLDALIQGVRLPATGLYGIAVLSPIGDGDTLRSTGGYQLRLTTCANVGPDLDGDGLVDLCDDDDDDDGFRDSEDSAPTDPARCADFDVDECDDCSSGAFDPFDDGPDSDADTICDARDVDDDNDGCEDLADPAPLVPSVDADLDFYGEECDTCPGLANVDQADLDGDGLGDACEDDTDGDGLPDAVETGTGVFVSPDDTGTDPRRADSDGDGLGDAAELAAGTSPHAPDSDADGAGDLGDVCPLAADAAQLDRGGVAAPADPQGALPNGIGDVCECGDLDGDGRVNPADLAAVREFLAGGALAPDTLAHCGVRGAGDCDVVAFAVLARAFAGLPPGIAGVCEAAGGL
jgi:hypothetical protein